MKIYTLVGKSGTGKSFHAMELCRKKQIESIIDDGLFIYQNTVVAGVSAKRDATKIGAVKTALFQKDEIRDEVAQAIDRLPEDMRTVLILSALENRPYEEIARITGSPVGTVKSRLNRARVKLAEILSRMREPSAEKRVQHGERRTAP